MAGSAQVKDRNTESPESVVLGAMTNLHAPAPTDPPASRAVIDAAAVDFILGDFSSRCHGDRSRFGATHPMADSVAPDTQLTSRRPLDSCAGMSRTLALCHPPRGLLHVEESARRGKVATSSATSLPRVCGTSYPLLVQRRPTSASARPGGFSASTPAPPLTHLLNGLNAPSKPSDGPIST